MVALTPASILTYLVPGSPGSTLASAGDLNYASFTIELSPLFVNKNLPETRAAIYRCTSTAETGSAIITIPISYEPAYIENTASGIGDGQSGLYYTFYHAGDPDDDTQTPIDIYSAAQSRSIATLSPGQILIFAWDFMLTISQSPTETLPASHGYLIYDPLSQSLPLGGTTGQVLTRTADGYEWQTIEAAPDELPAGGAAGDVLTRTSDGSEWASLPDEELPSGGTPSQLLTRTADGSEWANAPTELPSGGDRFQILEKSQTGVIWADKYPSGLRGQVLTAGATGVASFRNLPPNEIPSGGNSGEILTRGNGDEVVWAQSNALPTDGEAGNFLRRQSDGDGEWVELPNEGALEGNPKLQTRTYQDGIEPFPLLAGNYTITTSGDYSIVRIAFDPSEEHLALNLRDDVVEINLYRQGEANIRFLVDQDNKAAPVRRVDNSDDTSAVILRILEVRTLTSNLPTWLSQTGTTTFYIYGEADPDALSSEELATQARISALSELNFVLQFNNDPMNLDGPGDNGNLRANTFDQSTHRNLAFLPDDAGYERILEASLEGRLDTITLRANRERDTTELDPEDLSSIARTATYDIDVLEFPDDRSISGNRINIRIRGTFDPTWSTRRQTRFFVLNFTTLTPALSSSFATYRYFKASRDPASATDRVVNVGLGSVADGGGGVRFSANADEIIALKALGFELGDDVEIIGFTSEDVHIDGAYLRWDNFTLTYDEVLGTAILVSPSALPAAFATPADKISIHLFPGSRSASNAALNSLFQRDNPFEFTWIVRKDGQDPVRGLKQIRRQPNFLRWSKEGNTGNILQNSAFEEGDDITLSSYDAQGRWIDNFTLIWNTHTSLDTTSSSEYIELLQSGNDRPLNNATIRASTYLKIRFHPGSKKIKEQNLLANESGLFYQGIRLEQAPTADSPGIFPDAATRTITRTVGEYERERIIEEDLGEGDLMELTAFNALFLRTKREFKHLASAPTFAGGNVAFTFLDSDPPLNIEFGRSMNLQVIVSKVVGGDVLESFRTTTTRRTTIANGDADTAGTYGFFNPANFGADDINRVMQLIEPISELGVFQSELENINRVEFRTAGATPEIYEFASPPFITESNSGEGGTVSYIQFFFNRVVAAHFRDATGEVYLTYYGEEDLRARNEITALTTRVDTNQAEIQTNATAASANALAIAANTTAIAAGTGTTDNIAHIAARSDVLHIVAARTDDPPSATNQRIQLINSRVFWHANDRAIVLALGFGEGDTIIVEGRDANNAFIESVACVADHNGLRSTNPDRLQINCDGESFPNAIMTAAFISLTLIPSRGNDLAIAANTEARNSGWILQRQWGGTGGEVWTGNHQNAGVEIGYDAEAVRENRLVVSVGTTIITTTTSQLFSWNPELSSQINFIYDGQGFAYILRMRQNVGTSPLTKNRVSFNTSARADLIYRLYSRN